jgi:hypothetical protein
MTHDPIAARQRPPAGRVVLDHIAHFVRDLGAATRVLETLGFVLTPFSEQSTRDAQGNAVPAGSANRCVMLESGYLEILTPTFDTPNARLLRAAIARHTGLHLIALGTPAAEEEHARLAAHGFTPLPPVRLERTVDLDGKPALARFALARVPPETMPEGRIQFVEQITPECLWQERYLGHTNGVTALRAVFVVAEDVQQVAARLAHFSALLPRRAGAFAVLDTARGSLLVALREDWQALLGAAPAAPALAGYALECADPQSLAARFETVGGKSRKLSEDLYSGTLPPALGAAWMFGTHTALERWLNHGMNS